MHIYAEISALFVIWALFVAIVSAWAIRIVMLLNRQRRAELVYRMHLAMTMGAAARDQSRQTRQSG
jgi:hypothetical protein